MDIRSSDPNMAVQDPATGLSWYNAGSLTLEGKGWTDTPTLYSRLPQTAKGVVRDAVWDLGKCPAGLCIRFLTASLDLAVRWDSHGAMDHMPATGCSGLDLYVKHEATWKWLAVGRPQGDPNETELFSGLPEEEREYMLYLPLYSALGKIELGLPAGSSLAPAPVRTGKPVVFYGTSITQGGCASRPGMCHTAILGRWLDRPVINLGFSGNGIMEPEIFDLLCELDPALYVLDALPNMQKDGINQRCEPGIRKLRAARPNTPIVLIDNPLYCDAYLKTDRMERYTNCNRAQYAVYEKLTKEGMTGLHYINNDPLIGNDGEATVDGTHFTDLGYMRFSEAVIGPIRKILI